MSQQKTRRELNIRDYLLKRLPTEKGDRYVEFRRKVWLVRITLITSIISAVALAVFAWQKSQIAQALDGIYVPEIFSIEARPEQFHGEVAEFQEALYAGERWVQRYGCSAETIRVEAFSGEVYPTYARLDDSSRGRIGLITDRTDLTDDDVDLVWVFAHSMTHACKGTSKLPYVWVNYLSPTRTISSDVVDGFAFRYDGNLTYKYIEEPVAELLAAGVATYVQGQSREYDFALEHLTWMLPPTVNQNQIADLLIEADLLGLIGLMVGKPADQVTASDVGVVMQLLAGASASADYESMATMSAQGQRIWDQYLQDGVWPFANVEPPYWQ